MRNCSTLSASGESATFDGSGVELSISTSAHGRRTALEVDTSFASRRVRRVLDEIIEHRGEPRAIRCDNGPEVDQSALPGLVH